MGGHKAWAPASCQGLEGQVLEPPWNLAEDSFVVVLGDQDVPGPPGLPTLSFPLS